MQSRNLLFFILIILLSSVFISSCTIPSSVRNAYKFKKSNIKLKVVGDSGSEKLEINEHKGPRCKNNNKGCIKANRGTISLIDFHLVASKDWYFTEMKICSGEDKPTISDPCSMTTVDRAEFSAGAPKHSPRYRPGSKGVIDLTKISNDLSKFNLLDANRFPFDAESDPVFYYYTITACKGIVCATLDPPIENKGGGGTWGL